MHENTVIETIIPAWQDETKYIYTVSICPGNNIFSDISEVGKTTYLMRHIYVGHISGH